MRDVAPDEACATTSYGTGRSSGGSGSVTSQPSGRPAPRQCPSLHTLRLSVGTPPAVMPTTRDTAPRSRSTDTDTLGTPGASYATANSAVPSPARPYVLVTDTRTA